MTQLTLDSYPALREPTTWFGTMRVQFELHTTPPPLQLISNVKIVPFVGDQVVITQVKHPAGFYWDLPGGTLEPDESYQEAVQRELLEEVGARTRNFTVFGVWHRHSSAPQPYRSHQPHPESYMLVGYSDVELIAPPQNPSDAEEVLAVACVSVAEASQRLRATNGAELAEVYELAAALRAAKQGER